MAKRIRHLEYYGYADQNVYIGLPNMDLSDIRETNREQDKEIDAISGATKEKADLDVVKELSGKVDSFIETQSEINDTLAAAISANTDRIISLEERDREITDIINELVDDFDPIYGEIAIVSGKTDALERRLNEHIDKSHHFERHTKREIDEIKEQLGKKLDKDEAEDTYAKKSDVYTKREVDDLINGSGSGYATEEWVLSKGYITEAVANDRYASKRRVGALEQRLTDVQTDLYDQYNHLNSDFIAFTAETNNRIGSLYTTVDTLSSRFDREIGNLQTKDADLQSQINGNKEAIRLINDVSLPNKVDKGDFNDLRTTVNLLGQNLNTKVDKTTYEYDKAVFGQNLDSLDDRKADKRDLNAVSGAIGAVDSKIDAETNNRIAADSALGTRIDATNSSILDIREENLTRDSRLTSLESRLTQEINDRANGDNSIIGSAADRDDDLTIYGLRKYADKVAANALNDAEYYADQKDAATRTYVDEKDYVLEQQITGKADKAYVNAVKNEIEATIDNKIAVETQRAVQAEQGLSIAVANETSRAMAQERVLISGLTHTSNIVKAITDWDGDDRASYTDEGNGILDVLHREVHDLKSKIANTGEGIITSNGYEVAFGTYNVSNTGFDNAEKTVFSIGVGTSEVDRRNAIEVRKNGDVYLWIEGEYMCINTLLAMLTHETY